MSMFWAPSFQSVLDLDIIADVHKRVLNAMLVDESWDLEDPDISSEDYISWVQRSLNRLLGIRLVTDGRKTAAYRAAVRRFRERQGLSPATMVDKRTQDALIIANENDPSYVTWVQRALSQVSGRALRLTGRKDSATRRAIMRFQRRHGGLKVDGVVGAKTETALIRACGCHPPGEVKRKTQTRTVNIDVVIKSYIGRVGARTGFNDKKFKNRCVRAKGHFRIPLLVSLNDRLKRFARATDAAYSENPRHAKRDGKYRLYSGRRFQLKIRKGRLVRVKPFSLDIHTGKEPVPGTRIRGSCVPTGVGVPTPKSIRCRTHVQAPPGSTTNVRTVKVGDRGFLFSWTARGRPNRISERAYQKVCRRSSKFIWHTVFGQVDFSGGAPKVALWLSGSGFPTHRAFVDGAIEKTVRQAGLSKLWIPSAADPALVQ